MHDDNAFDDEELFTEDGELKDEYIEDDPESEKNDNDDNDDNDDDDSDDNDDMPKTLEDLIADFGMVEDEEGNWVYPEDLDQPPDDDDLD